MSEKVEHKRFFADDGTSLGCEYCTDPYDAAEPMTQVYFEALLADKRDHFAVDAITRIKPTPDGYTLVGTVEASIVREDDVRSIGLFTDEIRINYCPVCGRELSVEDDRRRAIDAIRKAMGGAIISHHMQGLVGGEDS